MRPLRLHRFDKSRPLRFFTTARTQRLGTPYNLRTWAGLNLVSRLAPRRASFPIAAGSVRQRAALFQTRLKTSVPFVPPNPNEFFSATSIFISRAVLAQ